MYNITHINLPLSRLSSKWQTVSASNSRIKSVQAIQNIPSSSSVPFVRNPETAYPELFLTWSGQKAESFRGLSWDELIHGFLSFNKLSISNFRLCTESIFLSFEFAFSTIQSSPQSPFHSPAPHGFRNFTIFVPFITEITT